MFKSYLISGIVFASGSLLTGAARVGPAPSAVAQGLKLPARFEQNLGQAQPGVSYVARASGLTALISGGQTAFILPGGPAPNRERRMKIQQGLEAARPAPLIVRQKFRGASEAVAGSHSRPLKSVSNYFKGNDPTRWRAGVPHYGRVDFKELYKGIGVAYYASGSDLEYDLLIEPAADPSQIEMLFEGADSAQVGENGQLVLNTRVGRLLHGQPRGYQVSGSRRVPVPVRYKVDGLRVSFDIGEYDRSKPLVIDPVITFSSYWGGSGTDYFVGIRVDGAGSVYAGGDSDSLDVPLVNSYLPDQPDFDIAILKISASGGLIYSSFVGGSSSENVADIAVDTSGSVYAAGSSSSPNFPTVNPYQLARPGLTTAILFKLGPSGSSLGYSTYLWGAAPVAVEVDAAGSAYIGGITNSPIFPVLGAFQSVHGNLGNPYWYDAFVAKFTPAGNQLVYSTLLGGSGNDVLWDIAIDPAGAVCLTGQTRSDNFPTRNPVQAARNGAYDDVFVTKLNPQGNGLIYSTYWGGTEIDIGRAIASDSSGAAYVAGSTESSDYPLLNPLQTNLPYSLDAVVTKLNPSGTLAYSTYLGGSAGGYGEDITVDSSGSAYVIGTTFSADFPLVNPLGPVMSPASFLSKFNPAGNQLTFSTYLPLTLSNIAVHGATGVIHLGGATGIPSIPTVNGLQPYRGLSDMLIIRISQAPPTFPKDACMNEGWRNLTRADGSTFKNQGDCIQYANTGK